MSTDLRSILERVAAGELSPAEGQQLLDDVPAPRTGRPAVARLAVRGTGARLTVVADPTVDTAVADGPHRVEVDGDRLTITAGSDDGEYETQTPMSMFATWINKGLRAGTRLRVRVNPNLPLEATVVAGSLLLSGVQAPVQVSVDAGTAKLEGGRGPVRLTATTASLDVAWQFVGDCTVGAELSTATVRVQPGSDVVVTTDCNQAKVTLTSPAGAHAGAPLAPATAGAGTGTLKVSARLGNADIVVA